MPRTPPKSALLTTMLLSAALAGCASITRGTTETFVVETFPSDAVVTTSFGAVCRSSPCAFPGISREASFSVRVERPGYRAETHNIGHRLAGGGAAGGLGNAAIPVIGVIGLVVDSNTGATQSLSPNPLRVSLQPLPR